MPSECTDRPKPELTYASNYRRLEPAAKRVISYVAKVGSISARDAMMDLDGMTSGSLTRRIVDIEQAGYEVTRKRRTHKVSGRPYTRYVIDLPQEPARTLLAS